MFNPIEKTKGITIEQGDYIAAMCSMFNGRSHAVSVGYERKRERKVTR
jgi:hypothetical protein